MDEHADRGPEQRRGQQPPSDEQQRPHRGRRVAVDERDEHHHRDRREGEDGEGDRDQHRTQVAGPEGAVVLVAVDPIECVHRGADRAGELPEGDRRARGHPEEPGRAEHLSHRVVDDRERRRAHALHDRRARVLRPHLGEAEEPECAEREEQERHDRGQQLEGDRAREEEQLVAAEVVEQIVDDGTRTGGEREVHLASLPAGVTIHTITTDRVEVKSIACATIMG